MGLPDHLENTPVKGDSRRQEDLVFSSLLSFISEAKSYRSEWAERQADMSTLIERNSHEGRGFLRTALPSLGRSIDNALHGDAPLCCKGFAVRTFTCLPDFLHDLFVQVFDPEDGFLLPPEMVNPLALRELRQVCYYAYKEEYPFDREHQDKAVRKMRTVDASLPDDNHVVEPDVEHVLEFASRLVGDVFAGFNPYDITPGHGPGAVATKEKSYEKMDFRRIYTSVCKEYPYQRYFTLGWHNLNNIPGHFPMIRRKEPTSKMALVPKDSRGPRTISMEPLEVQWIQQGLKTALYDWIENHSLTKGHVNFTNQEINGKLALESSLTEEFDTVDLKDASNRNSLWLVRRLWKHSPRVLRCLEATRSTRMRLLDDSEIELKMFAPMGSAVCFPIEAIVFWSLTVACLVVIGKLPMALALRVWVFGDDIILPHGHIDELMRIFKAVGLEVNLDKSCATGKFRESCGVDAFFGNDVTPLKIKLSPPSSLQSAASIVSWTERANAFLARDYPATARLIHRHIEDIVGELPSVPLNDPDVGFLHKRTCCESSFFSRKTCFFWSPFQQTWYAEVWTWAAMYTKASPWRNWSALLLSLTSRGVDVQTDKFATPKSLRLRKSWVCLHGMPAAVRL